MRSSGEVEGVVDFREEEVVLVRSLEVEVAEADNRSKFFPDEDGEVTEGSLGLRDVVAETEGSAERGLREGALVSVAPVETARLAGSAAGRVLGIRGDLEAAFVGGLVTFLILFGGSASVLARRKSVPVCVVGELEHTWLLRGPASSSSRCFSE